MKKEQTKKPIVEVDDVLTVEFIRNEKKSGKPICRLPNGMVGFIHATCTAQVLPRSVWNIRVLAIYEKHAYVVATDKVKSAYENLRDIDAQIKSFDKPKRERIAKPKVKYTNI